jgi:hypothetical protein
VEQRCTNIKIRLLKHRCACGILLAIGRVKVANSFQHCSFRRANRVTSSTMPAKKRGRSTSTLSRALPSQQVINLIVDEPDPIPPPTDYVASSSPADADCCGGHAGIRMAHGGNAGSTGGTRRYPVDQVGWHRRSTLAGDDRLARRLRGLGRNNNGVAGGSEHR